MPKYYPLDKIIDVDTDYEMEARRGYKILAVGTDSDSKATVKVEGAPVLEVVKDIAPLLPELTNKNPALNLGDNFIVVAPNEKIRFEGSSGSKMRIFGQIFELGPGEALPGDLAFRREEQIIKYLTYFTGNVTAAAGVTVSKNTEVFPIDIEVGAGRKYTLDREYMAEGRLDDLVHVPNFFSRIYLNGDPQDILSRKAGPFGIYGGVAPNPPREVSTLTTDIEAQRVSKKAMSLKDFPIELLPGDKLKIGILNETADYTVPTGKTLNRIVHVVALYQKAK